MRLLILGDSHGHLDRVHGLLTVAVEHLHIDAAIQVGDFGFFPRTMSRFVTRFGRFPVPLHVIDGNHEDHCWLRTQMLDGIAATWPDRHRLEYHPRGTATIIGGATIGFLGGAWHVDRPQEDADIFWRRGEEPLACNWIRPSDRDRALVTWRDTPPDLIVTHSAPTGVGVGVPGEPARVPDVHEFIDSRGWSAGPLTDVGEPELGSIARHLPWPTGRTWLFGHFHRLHDHKVAGTRFVCVGSSDGSDGRKHPAVIIYDTITKSLTVNLDGWPSDLLTRIEEF